MTKSIFFPALKYLAVTCIASDMVVLLPQLRAVDTGVDTSCVHCAGLYQEKSKSKLSCAEGAAHGSGRAVLPYARAALAAVAGARLAVDELTGLVRRHVTIGMVTACSSLDLTNLLAAFAVTTPASRQPPLRPTPTD